MPALDVEEGVVRGPEGRSRRHGVRVVGRKTGAASVKVALYAYKLAYAEPTGVDRYVSQLARALFARHPDRYRLLSSAESTHPPWAPAGMPVTRLPGPRRARHLAWALARRPRIDRYAGGANVLHVLVPTWPVPSRMPVVYTLHDVMPIEHPEWFTPRDVWLFREAARDAAARATRIVCVSSTVAEAAAATLAIDRARIAVVHEGVDDRFRIAPAADDVAVICRRFGVEPARYLLFVGRVSTRKNLPTLVRAIAERGEGAKLLIAGPPGLGIDAVLAEIERLRLTTEVLMAGHVPDRDLPALMAGALALVHPSEYEGFGLTPLEAMALGRPAIVARAGALPEVLGDAALLLDPHDTDAWAAALTRVEHDSGYAAALARKGTAHARRFTWERAAEATAAVHEAAASE